MTGFRLAAIMDEPRTTSSDAFGAAVRRRHYRLRILFPLLLIAAGKPLLAQEQPPQQAFVRPVVSLLVTPSKLTISRSGGRVHFGVDAVPGRFQGTISGTITVSKPVDFNNVKPVEGQDSRSFPFTLSSKTGAGSEHTGYTHTGEYTISAPQGSRPGTLIYVVSFDPSCEFEAAGSPAWVTVSVE